MQLALAAQEENSRNGSFACFVLEIDSFCLHVPSRLRPRRILMPHLLASQEEDWRNGSFAFLVLEIDSFCLYVPSRLRPSSGKYKYDHDAHQQYLSNDRNNKIHQ